VKNIIILFLNLSFLVSCSSQKNSIQNSNNAPLNVLFISVDDLNNYLGYFGDPNALTPHMDKLAKNGTAFINAHCQAPLCGPSRASILSGIRPSTSGIYGMIHDDSIRTGKMASESVVFLPEYLKEFGYKTYGVGKIFHSFAPKGVFDIAGGRFSGPTPNHNFGPKPKKWMAWDGLAKENPDQYGRTSTDWGPFPEQDPDMPDFHNTQWAIDQLNHHNSENPFFLAIGYLRPHVPLHVPQKWFDMYPLDDIKLPTYDKNDFNDIPDIAKNKVSHLPMMPTTEWAIETNNWKKILQAYLACISFVDNEIGKLIAALESSPYASNTVIVLWSDHGYRVGEKGTFAKQALWEPATKTPLIFHGPHIPKGKKVDAPVELLSIYPTLLELCQLPPYTGNEGRSLVPLIGNQIIENDYAALTTYGWSNHSVRTQYFRYIRYEDGAEELYDMQKDPNEFVNLSNNLEYKEIIESHKALLPLKNARWHINSNYTFQPYFIEQKERVNNEHRKQ
jgi:arylsulfatase A-like enzyme